MSTWKRLPLVRAIRTGLIDLDAPPIKNITALAKAKRVPLRKSLPASGPSAPCQTHRCSACNRRGHPADRRWRCGRRHPYDAIRMKPGIDIYIGSGGAPEGVLAAAALRCIGGQMQGRLISTRREDCARRKDGHHRSESIYTVNDMARATSSLPRQALRMATCFPG